MSARAFGPAWDQVVSWSKELFGLAPAVEDFVLEYLQALFMQSLEDGSAADSIQSLPMAASTMKLPKQRHSVPNDIHPLAQSEASLPYRDRRSNPSAASLFASTLTPPGSRSASRRPAVPIPEFDRLCLRRRI